MSLHLEYLGPNKWRVVSEYRWHSKRLKRPIVVPPGFKTDLASVPRLLLPLVDDDNWAAEGVIHDYIYRKPVMFPKVNRKTADKVMIDKAKESGKRWITRKLVYCAIRLGGRGAWKKWR